MKPYIWMPVAMLAATPYLHAQQIDTSRPDRMVKGTIEDVMSTIRNDPAARAGNSNRIYEIVQQKFLPHTDFRLTTQYAVGHEYWNKATPVQREALFQQFQVLLANTYATQLTQSRGENTQFKFPPMAPLPSTATDAVVRTQVTTGNDTEAIQYRVRKVDGVWKIYDIDMMGAWMIQVYRQQFAAEIKKGGIDGLIKYLAAHNEASA
jgi:ABC-type transporter MlaC component